MNEDNHLFRTGRRFTYEDTYGEPGTSRWVKKGIGEGVFDRPRWRLPDHIYTGNHRLLNRTFGMDMSFSNGVKVWPIR